MPRRWRGARRWCSLGWALDAEDRRLPKVTQSRLALRPPAGFWPYSFRYATLGLIRVWRSERNVRVQAAAGWFALILAWVVRLSGTGTAVLIGITACVLAAETLNTALETAVDLVAPERHPLAGAAKDLAAGGVLCVSLGAIGAGLAVFWPWLSHPGHLVAALAVHALPDAVGLAGLAFLVAAAAAPLAGRRAA